MRDAIIHVLKIDFDFFRLVDTGLKSFDLRPDDRDFQVDDVVVFQEIVFTHGHEGRNDYVYTGEMTSKRITYILRNAERYGLKPGFCCLALERVAVPQPGSP